MTTEEKLQHFLDFCMEDSRNRSNSMLDEYTSALEQTFKEHQADAHRRADMQVSIEKEKIARDINKQLAIEQINLKRIISQKQDELKDKLFVELRNKLAQFMETPAYFHLLEAQIKAAREFAGAEELILYLDPSDEDKLNRLALHQNVLIKVSQYSFGGGTRAVIPSKNILIDNSFDKKLEEAKQDFHFETGGMANV